MSEMKQYFWTDTAGRSHSAMCSSPAELQQIMEQTYHQSPATHADMMMVAGLLREILEELRKGYAIENDD